MRRAMLVSALLSLLVGMTLADRSDAALYWAGSGITRVNVDGSLSTPEFIRTQDASVCAIAVDHSHVYWVDGYSDTIGRANLDGTNVEDDFISPAGGVPCGIALDAQHLYWANRGGESIGRARLDGSHVETKFISAPENPCGVAVTSTAIYWSSETEGVIRRTDIGGLNGPEVVVSGATTPCGLAVDASHLFWANSDLGTVGRASLDGTEVLQDFIVGGEFPASVALIGTYIYWVNAGWGFESIGRANLDGTDVNQRFLAGLRNPYALAVDEVQIAPSLDPQKGLSSFTIGTIKRNRQSGVVHVGVDLPAHGVLRAAVTGGRAQLAPRVLEDGRALDAGRGWLKLSPLVRRGGRCVVGRTDRIRVTLYLTFAEPGKEPAGKSKKLLLRPIVLPACSRVRHRRH